MADVSKDALAQLPGASFRGVPFPVTRMHRAFDHDQAEHKWPDRDGGHVEATGRNLEVFNFSIPFRNGVVPGKNDLFGGRVIYPDLYKAFEAAMLDRTSGPLVHPELGQLTVKPLSFSSDVSGDRRDGADVEVSFKESLDNEDDLLKLVQSDSPVSAAVAAASDLDDLTGQMNPPPPKDPYTPSFSDMMRSVQAAIDTPTLLSKQIGGQIDQISGALSNLEFSIQQANDTGLWPIVQAISRLKSAIFDMKSTLLTTSAPIRQYVTKIQTTFAALATLLANKTEDLIRLNPLLLDSPIIETGVAVRYYLSTTTVAPLVGVPGAPANIT